MTNKQKVFVQEYLIDLNATQAAIRAGYKPNNAGKIGSELLEKTRIQEEVEKALAKRSKRTGINQDRIVRELAKIAFVNIDDVMDNYGEIKPTASRDDLACIESMKVKISDNQYGESVEREVKMASKLKALELLGRHVGMWNDKLNMNINLPIFFEGEDDLED